MAALFPMAGFGAVSQEALNELLTPYLRSQVVDSSDGGVVDYRLATGATQKVSGRWAPEEELRRAGELSRVTLQIPSGHDAEEIYRYYRQRLAALDARALYLCSERNCGSSNSWANDVFQIKQLYGLDQDQYYGIFEAVDQEDQLNYVVIYTVRRGNGRVYAHLELLRTEQESALGVAPNPGAIAEQLRDRGYYAVSGLRLQGGRLEFQPEHMAALAQALRRDRLLSVRVVGHDYARGSLDEQMERSRGHARRLVERLVEEGVPEDRLEVHGVGSLVPPRSSEGKRDQSFRVELVVR
ncbi:DUF4892 domain-containing protein [Gilvimarinus sp. F26214L]|uniref:DUF4892 domain-containing protein n=1 Tax=Gilvimarinus sp. DZF01 TaxID=3461371 RepID=UPI00404636D2